MWGNLLNTVTRLVDEVDNAVLEGALGSCLDPLEPSRSF